SARIMACMLMLSRLALSYSVFASAVLVTRSTAMVSRCFSSVDSEVAETTAIAAISRSRKPKPANMRLPTVKRWRNSFMTASGEGCCGQETARPPGRLFGGNPDRGAVRSAHLSAHLWRPLNEVHEDHQYVRSPWRIGSVPWMPGNTHAAPIRCRQARDCRLGHAIAGPNLNNRTAPATRWDRAAAVMGRRWATLARCSQALFLRRTTIRRR